jgi:protein-L-isoaspartate(D-aspartate) O-methyltransferase
MLTFPPSLFPGTAMNYETARHHMIEQQLRTWNVLDAAVVDTLYADRREEFVPAAYRALAFADIELPLGPEAVMLAPKIEARALQALALTGSERVLEIGTGTGHMAALLAARAASVVSVEIDAALAEQARANLARTGCANVQVVVGDGLAQLSGTAQGPFDAILVSGSLTEVPAVLLEQLADGGRLLAFVGVAPLMALRKIVRNDSRFVAQDVMETVVPPLRQPAASRFAF